jgi:hypothetical protein
MDGQLLAIGGGHLEDADVQPHEAAGLGARPHLEVLHRLTALRQAPHVAASIAEAVAVAIDSLEDLAARPLHHLPRRPAQDALRRAIPEPYAPIFRHHEGAVARLGQGLLERVVASRGQPHGRAAWPFARYGKIPRDSTPHYFTQPLAL